MSEFHYNIKRIANTRAGTYNLKLIESYRIVEIKFDLMEDIIDDTICVNISERISKSKAGCLFEFIRSYRCDDKTNVLCS